MTSIRLPNTGDLVQLPAQVLYHIKSWLPVLGSAAVEVVEKADEMLRPQYGYVFIRLAGLSGMLAVGLGAYGAHCTLTTSFLLLCSLSLDTYNYKGGGRGVCPGWLWNSTGWRFLTYASIIWCSAMSKIVNLYYFIATRGKEGGGGTLPLFMNMNDGGSSTTVYWFHVKTATNNNGDTHLTRTATMEYRNGDNQFNLKRWQKVEV